MAVINENNNDAGTGVETQYSISMGDSFQGTLATTDDVDWVKIELDADTIYDISQTDGEDVRLSLLDAEGTRIINDRPPGHKIIFSPDESGTFYIRINTRDDEAAGEYEVSLAENTIPIGTYDAIADYLTDGWWEDWGSTGHAVDVETGGVLTVNITALNADGQQLARWALEAWTYVTGIEFELVEDDNAFLTFDDPGEGDGYAETDKENGIINSARVIISADTLSVHGTEMGSWSFFAYIHEIGHALGLGHTKPESAAKDFGNGTIFLIDSFQASVLSGFYANNNTYINDSRAHPVTPMIADIIAIQNLYGEPEDSNGGDTVYGYQSNVDGYLGEFFRLWTGENNPFIHVDPQDYSGFYYYTLVSSGDLDGDGDLDLVTGSTGVYLHYFENTGTASAPEFTKRSGADNPFDGFDLGLATNSVLADLDDDGDLDLISGSGRSYLAYLENTGTASAPAFTQRTGSSNPVDGIASGAHISPALADLDGDGDLDLLTGNQQGELAYFENTGSDASPDFSKRTGTTNPFNTISAEVHTDPEFADIDNDGDVDLILWNWYGKLNYFENTGSATAPVFTQRTGDDMPLNIIAGSYAPPELADLDGDGDLDLVAMHNSVELRYFVNDGTTSEPDFILEQLGGPAALTLYDTGGSDTLDLRTDRDDQRIDLRPEGISDVYGLTGNLVIARDVLIENAIAGYGNDVVIGNSAVNRLEGRAGDDVLEGGAGADTLDGGAGNDTVAYTESDRGVGVRLSTNAGRSGHAEGDTLISIENITGSAHTDNLGGNAEANILNGGPGNDGLWGSGGDDTLIGGPGADRFYGGGGQDTADYTDSPAGVTVRLHSLATAGGDAEGDTFMNLVDVSYTDADGAMQTESLPDVENLTGSAYNDVLAGDRRDNVLDGGAGDDTLYGGPGGGDDLMLGNAGNDRLFGGLGNDRLDGGAGNDRLAGGAGGDVFVFAPGHGADTITDFTNSQDRIDLTAYDLSGYDDLTVTSGTDGVTIDLSAHDGGAILLEGFAMANLDAADFLF